MILSNALCAVDSIEFEEKKIYPESGDVIVFYNDGDTEAMNRKKLYT